MKKLWLFLTVIGLAAPLSAQETSADKLSTEEAAAVAAILAKNAAQQAEDKIVLPEATKQQAFDEVNPPAANPPAAAAPETSAPAASSQPQTAAAQPEGNPALADTGSNAPQSAPETD